MECTGHYSQLVCISFTNSHEYIYLECISLADRCMAQEQDLCISLSFFIMFFFLFRQAYNNNYYNSRPSLHIYKKNKNINVRPLDIDSLFDKCFFSQTELDPVK